MAAIWSRLGPRLQFLRRRIQFRLAALTGRESALPPPALARLNGPGDFVEMGEAIVRDLQEAAGLQADHSVLDVGCGAGRTALGLTQFLSSNGRYEGFDIVPEAVAWCQRNISSAHPNFQFELADLSNPHYHRGASEAGAYRFAYDDASFNTAVVTSVFTHLRAAATANYIDEIARVLRPGGAVMATFFLVDEQSRAAMASGAATFSFSEIADGSLVANVHDPEGAVGHDKAELLDQWREAGLEPEVVWRGDWSAHPEGTRHQDVIVARKPTS
ncbi:MAG: class I SAM-dependent methyltransferase [Acidimicrobiales bacterium]|nr:class I SAM-dependent methyltransferase [Acidimicrobiales bacterium]